MFKSTATSLYLKAIPVTAGLATLAALSGWIRGS